MNTPSTIIDVLHSDGPSADRAEKMELYAWLIGSWELEVTEFRLDGSTRQRPAEWHFGWVLEGRAIQDVWIVPPRGTARRADAVVEKNYYGTTLRVYDPSADTWHLHYTDPVSQFHLTMTGRRTGDGIVQEGRREDGSLVRWSFYDIAPHSFRWRGESSADNGKTWRRAVEFDCRRMNTSLGEQAA